MIPILYDADEQNFKNNGLGFLSDIISCVISEERNGAFELSAEYPITGIHYDDLILRRIIFAKSRPNDEGQPFRIYRISRPLNGIVKIYAAHISYDLSGVIDEPFTAMSAPAAMVALSVHAIGENHFQFWTDKTTVATMNVVAPASIRSLLGGVAGSVLDTYGGELEFDKFTVKLYGSRGTDRGFVVRYGKNLIDLTQEENCSDCYTAVFPYWANEEKTITLTEKIITVGTFDYQKILVCDFSGDFDEAPTEEQLRARTQTYINQNNIGAPKISISVNFVELLKSEEYKDFALLEQVYLCDTITVIFEKLGVTATAKVVSVEYNTLTERYDSIQIGDAKGNIANTIAKQQKITENVDTEIITTSNAAARRASEIITGNPGGYVVFRTSEDSTVPNEILIMDKPDIETAVKVWRWNLGGLGYSNTGVNGEYTTAITIDGAINADFVTVGSLIASIIRTGVLSSTDGKTQIDLDGGTFQFGGKIVYDGSSLEIVADTLTIGGIPISDDGAQLLNKIGGYIRLVPETPLIEIGAEDSENKISVTNEKVELSASGNASATLSASEFATSQIKASNLRIGQYVLQRREANAHLTLKWVGD